MLIRQVENADQKQIMVTVLSDTLSSFLQTENVWKHYKLVTYLSTEGDHRIITWIHQDITDGRIKQQSRVFFNLKY